MRQILRTAAAVAAFLALGQSAHAQGFLKRLAERAVEQVEPEAGTVGNAKGSSGSGSETASEKKQSGVQEATPRVASKARQEPKTSEARYIDSLRKPADAEAQRVAYNEFGEVRCNDCEGGIDFDGRPKFPFDQFSGKYNERAARAGHWPVGHIHRWKGKESAGTLTVTAEESVEGFRCRRLEYRLQKGAASASRPSLICFGLANRSSEVENWHEIY